MFYLICGFFCKVYYSLRVFEQRKRGIERNIR